MKLMIAMAVAVAGAVASYLAPSPGSAPNVDPVTTASVTSPTTYSAVNLAENKSCAVARGKSASARTFAIHTEPGCADVWPDLVKARNWTENADGTVELTDKAGREVLTLARGDGVSYLTVNPPSAALTFTATD